VELGPEEAAPHFAAGEVKALEMFAGTETAYRLAKKYRVKTAWGADIWAMRGLPAGRGSISP